MNPVTDIRTRTAFDGQRNRRSTFDLPEPPMPADMTGEVWNPNETRDELRTDTAFLLGGLVAGLAFAAIALIVHYAPDIHFWASHMIEGAR